MGVGRGGHEEGRPRLETFDLAQGIEEVNEPVGSTGINDDDRPCALRFGAFLPTDQVVEKLLGPDASVQDGPGASGVCEDGVLAIALTMASPVKDGVAGAGGGGPDTQTVFDGVGATQAFLVGRPWDEPGSEGLQDASEFLLLRFGVERPMVAVDADGDREEFQALLPPPVGIKVEHWVTPASEREGAG